MWGVGVGSSMGGCGLRLGPYPLSGFGFVCIRVSVRRWGGCLFFVRPLRSLKCML